MPFCGLEWGLDVGMVELPGDKDFLASYVLSSLSAYEIHHQPAVHDQSVYLYEPQLVSVSLRFSELRNP